ncbi:MAG: DegT/DnrJ/EryC1/StrS family aminotransferase [archaeon]
MKDDCLRELGKLTGKKHILLTRRGNVSIRLTLKLAKHLGFSKVLLQDQGGWLTYRQFCAKEKLEAIEISTDHGILDPKALEGYNDCVLLINSMPAYSFLQEMKKIDEICKKNSIFLINDASGSIGTEEANYGDIILGSFGEDKPINLGSGGFITAESQEHYDFLAKNNPSVELDHKILFEKISNIKGRLGELKKLRSEIIKELEEANLAVNIIDKNAEGLNIIIKYSSEFEKERLINYCAKKGIEYTLCPREIRVKERAVCFEIKRK